MKAALCILWLAAAPCRASAADGGAIKLLAYDRDGKLMDLKRLLAHMGRADYGKSPGSSDAGLFITTPDGLAAAKPQLRQEAAILTLSWRRLPRVSISLPWPVEGRGFSTVWIDHDNQGFGDGDVVYLNEEIAQSEYRLFKEAWLKRSKNMEPAYAPGAKAKALAQNARALMAKAQARKEGAGRAAAFDRALEEIAAAWEAMLVEHAGQMARNERVRSAWRFGLTLDEKILERLDHYPWIIDKIKESGANWVRLVFASNPQDFAYAKPGSFNEYDAIVKELRAKGLRVMGTVLDTTQWPRTLTAEAYSERVKNLVLHYRGLINSWEVGSEINGDWLGGARAPLSPAEVFKIFSAGASQVKEIEPTLETVATLYWWDGTAPDEEHSLFGWLTKYGAEFASNIDVVSLSLEPEDNPVGLAFEPIFDRVGRFLSDKKLMLGSFGYIEGDSLKGYWWLNPDNVDAARNDLAAFYIPASCAVQRSVCGGFWWQTLEQMLPAKGKSAPLYRAYARALGRLSR